MFVKSTPKSQGKGSGVVYKPGYCVKLVEPGALLASRQHQHVLELIEQLAILPVEHYEACYANLLYDFTDFVQVIPLSPRRGLSSLLNESLYMAYYNLKEHVSEVKDQASALFRYALFTASLLRRIAYVVEKYRFVITNEKGLYISEWSPFDGSMLSLEANFFKMYPTSNLLSGNHAMITGMLVRLLMPRAGFDWIASDTELFHEWLSCLQSEDYAEGWLGKAIKKYYIDIDKINNPLQDFLPELIETPETKHGEAFYTWLKNGLADGSIKVNSGEAFVHHVSDGVFVEYPGLIKDFVSKVYNVPVNMNVVFEQFGNLFGLVVLSGDDFRNRQFFSDYPGVKGERASGGIMSRPVTSVRQGLVISDATKVFVDGNVPVKTRFLRSADKSMAKTNALPNVAAQVSGISPELKRGG